MKRRIHFLSACLACALFLGHARAASSPFIVDVWSTADGLPQSSVIALAQTRDGYLWLGTLNGLVRFDGNSFTPFNVNKTPGLPSDGIVFLFEDSRTNLWVGTDNGGLCLIQNGGLKNFETGGGGGKIIYAYEDEARSVWFCVSDGQIFCWKNGGLDLRPSFPPALWEQLFRRAFHLVVPGTSGGFWHLQSPDNHVWKWSGDRPEKDFGLFPWTPSVVAVDFRAPKAGGLAFDSSVMAAVADQEGNLVVGTHGKGVFWQDREGAWRHITTGENLSQDIVLSMSFDHEGNLWVGTDGGGLYRVRRNYLGTPDNLPRGVAKSAAEDSSGGLWVTYNARGLVYSLTNAVQNFGIGKGSNAWSVLVDDRQEVWAGTSSEGLFHFDGHSFQPVMAAQQIGPQIFSLFQSRDGKLWAGGQNGLASYDGTNWNFYSVNEGLPKNSVRALADDAQGNLWIGTEGGLFQLRAGKISPLNAPVKDISCLLVDREDTLWIGTSGHGLARFAGGHTTRCTSREGLAADDIGYLIGDDSGNLWFGAYEGLTRIDKKSLADFFEGGAKKIFCRTFLTRECSAGAQPAVIRSRDGKFLFPTIEGLVALNPADLKANPNAPPVVIESVVVDGTEQNASTLNPSWNQVITLTPQSGQVEIHFTSLNFSAPRHAPFGSRFRYRFEPRDHNWTDIGSERVLRFRIADLPARKFIFRVSACNEDGAWNKTGAILSINVLPPFWKTWWFLAAAALGLVAAIAWIIYLISTQKLKRQLRAARQKELIERERARIARDLHDQLGANLTQVTLLGEMAEMDKNQPDEVELHAQQICVTARETTHALDEIVWAINPSNDTLEGLANYACKYAQDYFALAGVSFRAELPTNLPPAPILPEVRHNVFLAFKESVNNVVKHAQATEARVKLQLAAEQFILSVEDNGRGLANVEEKKLRNGLKNMRKRMADVRGEFQIAPGVNGGTTVRLVVPLENK